MNWPEELSRDVVEEAHFGDRRILVYSSRPRNVASLFSNTAEAFPAREALKEGERAFTYRQLSSYVLEVASGLLRLGLKRGDRVALLTDNIAEYCICLLAASMVGAIAVPLNTRLTAEELGFLIEDSSPRLLVVDEAHLSLADGVRAKGVPVEHFVITSSNAPRHYSPWEKLLGSVIPAGLPMEVDEEDVAIILYTSGTTGLPKGAMITHFNLCNNIISVKRTLGTGPEDRTLIAVPLFHITGTMFQFLHMMAVGGSVVLMRTFKTRTMMELLAKEHITFFIGVPTIYTLMLMNPLLESLDLSSLRIAAYGGAPMPEETTRRLLAHFSDLHLHNTYGATETTGSCTMMPHQETIKRPAAVGLPFAVNEIRIADDRGRPLPPGEAGEIWVRGPNVVPGYWGNPLATTEEFLEGFWRSGDVGRMDGDGFLYLLDRKKDMINRGGEKIYSVEVENAICAHPKVQEAAVVGVSDPVFGEQVKAVVVPKPGEVIQEQDLREFLSLRLADYKVPKFMTFVKELPRNPGGKVIKSALRDTEAQ